MEVQAARHRTQATRRESSRRCHPQMCEDAQRRFDMGEPGSVTDESCCQTPVLD